MLKNFTFLLFLLLASNVSAQDSAEESNLIERFAPNSLLEKNGIRPRVEEKYRKYDRLIFDIHYNDWNGDNKLFHNRWSSIGFNTNFMWDIPLTKGNGISLGTGITHGLFRISHHNEFIVDSTNSYTTYNLISNLDGKRRLLGGNSISIPLELRFRTKGWEHFKLHIGGKIGYQLNVYSKTKWNGLNGRQFHKSYDFPDVNRLIYSAHFRIGIRNWGLFGSYNFNSIFGNKNSTQLNLVQMGISISIL